MWHLMLSYSALKSQTVPQDPTGLPMHYQSAVRSVTALKLATELAMLEDQHAIYLNAIPAVTDADSALVTALLPDDFWTKDFGIQKENSLTDRVGKYVSHCGGFGVSDDESKTVLEEARGFPKQ